MSELVVPSEQLELLEKEIELLSNKLTGDMFEDMELKDKIHNLQMQIDGVRPMDSSIECIGCGS